MMVARKFVLPFSAKLQDTTEDRQGGQTNPSGIHTQVGPEPYFFSRKEEGSMPSLLAIFSM